MYLPIKVLSKFRMLYALMVFAFTIAGYCSRLYADKYPAYISEHLGDALWAGMVYLIFRTLWPEKSLFFALIMSLSFCFIIEISQIYQANWINHIRSTTLGALVLGRSFIFIDFIRYTAGVFIAFLIDRYWFSRICLRKESLTS